MVGGKGWGISRTARAGSDANGKRSDGRGKVEGINARRGKAALQDAYADADAERSREVAASRVKEPETGEGCEGWGRDGMGWGTRDLTGWSNGWCSLGQIKRSNVDDR